MKALPIQYDESIPAWEKAIYAFLAEKERRSGSMRTVDAYSRQLQLFFGTTGKTPEQITPPDVFGFAHGIGPSGREPAAITIGARLACISSFYRFLMRMEIVTRNPCDQLERPKVSPSPPRGLSANEIRRLLAAISETPSGLRDRAIVITLALTGRRRTEVLNLKVRDIIQGDAVFYQYRARAASRASVNCPDQRATRSRLRSPPGVSRSTRWRPRNRCGRRPRGKACSTARSTPT